MPPFISPRPSNFEKRGGCEQAGVDRKRKEQHVFDIFRDAHIRERGYCGFRTNLAPCVFIFIAAPHKKQESASRRGASLKLAFSRALSFVHKQFSHSEKSARKQRRKGSSYKREVGAVHSRRLTSRFLLKLPIITLYMWPASFSFNAFAHFRYPHISTHTCWVLEYFF
jgi:hypothetical protein